MRSTNRDMDPDYRDYFRPRGGEFLTRGAAMASNQLVGNEYVGTPVGSARGSLASHLDSIGISSGANAANASSSIVGGMPRPGGPCEQMVDRHYVAVSSGAASGGINSVSVSRLQAAGGKEKYGERRNPTILRKST